MTAVHRLSSFHKGDYVVPLVGNGLDYDDTKPDSFGERRLICGKVYRVKKVLKGIAPRRGLILEGDHQSTKGWNPGIFDHATKTEVKHAKGRPLPCS